jgi:dTDP-4-amino-4,6-dideoxygalactose transaminase
MAGVRPIATSDGATPVFHLYVVRLLGRDAAFRDTVRERLAAAGVESGIHYPVPLHLQPAYAHLGHRPGDFPVAEHLAGEILSLPMFPEITEEQQTQVVVALRAALD